MQENPQQNILELIKFDEKGLIPAIAQDSQTGQILMFAWMNRESIAATIQTKFAHYFSRSRGKLWKKGETSGNTQIVKEILIDCDEDCLILKIEQQGFACHTGAKSCFFRNLMLVAVAVLMLGFGNAYAQNYHRDKVDNLVIFSENNMTYPLVKIARLYSDKKKVVVSVNFDHSNQLIKDIDEGEPADVFISSHPDWIEILKHKGLVDVYNLANVARDKLLLVVSKNNKKLNIEELSKLADIKQILEAINKQKIPLVIDSVNTSLGKYTDSILDKAKISGQKVYHRPVGDKQHISSFINNSDEYCGIVLASSIKNYENIVVIKEIEDHEIYYQALVVAGSNMDEARDFLKFIKSDAVREIFLEGGFLTD